MKSTRCSSEGAHGTVWLPEWGSQPHGADELEGMRVDPYGAATAMGIDLQGMGLFALVVLASAYIVASLVTGAAPILGARGAISRDLDILERMGRVGVSDATRRLAMESLERRARRLYAPRASRLYLIPTCVSLAISAAGSIALVASAPDVGPARVTSAVLTLVLGTIPLGCGISLIAWAGMGASHDAKRRHPEQPEDYGDDDGRPREDTQEDEPEVVAHRSPRRQKGR